MKKILIFFLCILFMADGVLAGYSYKANDIEFTPDDINWEATNVNDAINDIKDKCRNYTVETNLINRDSGIISIEIDHDNDNAYLINGQENFYYSLNSIDNFKKGNAYGGNYYEMGLYYSVLSLKKGDILYVKSDTTGYFGYILMY